LAVELECGELLAPTVRLARMVVPVYLVRPVRLALVPEV
jgi:hypothetical protein